MGRAGILLSDTPKLYYGYYLIGAAFVAQFLAIGTQNYVLTAFMAPMSEDLGWTRTEFSTPRSIGQFVMAAAGVFIGASVDRIGPRPLMLCGLSVLGAAIYATSFVQTLTGWLLLNGIALTLGAALIGNLVVNVTLSKWFVELRGSAVAWAAMGVSFAGIVITPGITWAIDAYGWRVAWQLLAAFTVCLMVPVALMMRRAPEDFGLHPDGKSAAQVAAGEAAVAAADYSNSLTRAQALRTPAFYLLVTAFGFFSVGISVMLLQTVPYISDAGFSRTTAAWMITVASIPAMLTKPVWGYFIDRSERPRQLAAMSAALTACAIFSIAAAQSAQSLSGLVFAYALLGCGWGGMIPLQEVIWARFFGRRHLGAIRGAALPIALGLSAAAPILSSYYYDVVGNYDGAILIVAALNLLSALLIWAIPKRA
ncbi:MAG: MFS transporter [Pseudomonadota bacterium]